LQALEYIRKACVIAPNHSLAHCVHGYLLLGTSGGIYFFTASHAPQFDAALDAFRRAYAIDKRDLNVFQGIVDAHLGAGRFKDALFASKEALQRAPKNPKALTLVGSVLGHSVEGRDKARAAFAKALALDSHCLDAVFASAKLDTTEKKYDAAIQLLTRHVSQHNPEFLHTKIANVYLLMEDAASASQHFQLALSFNSQYAPAISGLDRLEGNIKGISLCFNMFDSARRWLCF
jgi:anaphase-promoting complex subunit 7